MKHKDLVIPVEIYSSERKAEFLLSNGVDAKDYAAAKQEVRNLGLNPADITPNRPSF